MTKYPINYSLGTVFCVPLNNGEYARGIVARMDGQGMIFGYFWGPRLKTIPGELDESDLKIDTAILAGIFSGMGLSLEEWPQLGSVKSFRREDWPMPILINTEDDSDRVELVEYDEDTLEEKTSNLSTRNEVDIEAYPEDGLMGSGYVENMLTQILDSAAPPAA